MNSIFIIHVNMDCMILLTPWLSVFKITSRPLQLIVWFFFKWFTVHFPSPDTNVASKSSGFAPQLKTNLNFVVCNIYNENILQF